MPNSIQWSESDIKKLIRESISKSEVIRKMGGDGIGGGWYRLLNRLINLYSIDTSHFKGQGWSSGKTTQSPKSKVETEDLLTENSKAHGSSGLRRRLVKEGYLKNICSECGCDGNWRGKIISLQLDHINGNPSDNRIENLRILCPNCHAATETYCRGHRQKHKKQNICTCGKPISKNASLCMPCSNTRKTSLRWDSNPQTL